MCYVLVETLVLFGSEQKQHSSTVSIRYRNNKIGFYELKLVICGRKLCCANMY